jgi:hypothetical protein
VVLIERATGAEVLAHCRPATPTDRRRVRWYGFDWTAFGATVEVYKVILPRSRFIEGMVALEPRQGWVEVFLAAVAPQNRGRSGRYRAGGALFAVACQRSLEAGCDGFVAFDAKTVLVPHYATEYGATPLAARGVPRLLIEPPQAAALVARYIRASKPA